MLTLLKTKVVTLQSIIGWNVIEVIIPCIIIHVNSLNMSQNVQIIMPLVIQLGKQVRVKTDLQTMVSSLSQSKWRTEIGMLVFLLNPKHWFRYIYNKIIKNIIKQPVFTCMATGTVIINSCLVFHSISLEWHLLKGKKVPVFTITKLQLFGLF